MSKYLTNPPTHVHPGFTMYSSQNANEPGSEPRAEPAGSPYQHVSRHRPVSMLGLGLVVGAVIGAGAALLASPWSGPETRSEIRRRVRRIRGEATVWDKLGRELKRAAIRKRKAAERSRKKLEADALTPGS